jgi:predicted DNA-binding transcriptional regulator AlpA
MDQVTSPDTLLTERELATYLRISVPTVQRMRAAGTGPRFVQLSERRIGYRRASVDAWLAARTTDRIGGIETQRSNPTSGAVVPDGDSRVTAPVGQVA